MRLTFFTSASAFIGFLLFAGVAFSWTGPSAAAPSGNVAAPVNVGTTNQVKDASLGVNGLAVFGNSILQASSYLNWGTTSGSSGYGIRDNAGTLEFKNSGGSWASIQSTVSTLCGGTCGSQWATSGSAIYYIGQVGVGVDPSTTQDNNALQVKSSGRNFAIFSNYVDTTLRIGGETGSNNITLKTDTESQGIRLQPAAASYGTLAGLTVSGVGKVYIGTTADQTYNSQLTILEERGTDTPLNLKVGGTNAHSQIIFQNANGLVGNIYSQGSATVYNTSSDRRLKEDIRPTTLGLAQLMQIPVRDFSFIKDPTHTTTTGFIAQELEPVFPAAVTTNGDDGMAPLSAHLMPWSVDYGRVTPLIVSAIQELARKVDDTAHLVVDTLTSRRVETKELCVQKSDGSDVCVTGDELAKLLGK